MSILFIQLFLAGVLPALLVFFLPKNPSFFQKDWVKGFAIGVYLALIVLLIRESLADSGLQGTITWYGAGLLGSFFIGLFVKEFHHHHSESESKHIHNKTSTIRIFISDIFHNMVDGIAVSAGGFVAMFGILGHQTIQQFGQQVLLVESGVKPIRALYISIIISLSIFTTLFIGGFGEVVEPILIAVSAGIVSWKVFQDLSHAKYTKKYILGFLLGAFLLTMSLVLVPHTHEHEDEVHEESQVVTE